MLFIVLALLVYSVSGFSQNNTSKERKSPEEGAKRITDRMKTSLNLSDEQYSRVYGINLQKIKANREFRESKSKLFKEKKKSGEEFRNSMKGILNDEQLKSMKRFHKEKKFKREKKMNRMHRRK